MDEDTDILDEIHQKKSKKDFKTVINRSKFSQYDLEEVMMEA